LHRDERTEYVDVVGVARVGRQERLDRRAVGMLGIERDRVP
jgi:hypothetical protein